jgi:hypothetical protein
MHKVPPQTWPRHDFEIEGHKFRGDDIVLWFISSEDDSYLCRDGFVRGTAIPKGASHKQEDLLNNPICGYYRSEQEAIEQCARFNYTYILRGIDAQA